MIDLVSTTLPLHSKCLLSYLTLQGQETMFDCDLEETTVHKKSSKKGQWDCDTISNSLNSIKHFEYTANTFQVLLVLKVMHIK